MAPFYHSILAQKQLAVIFDLDETLLQAFTLSSLTDARTPSGERILIPATASFSRRRGEASDAATDAAGKTVAGALGAQPARAFADRPPADALRQARQRRRRTRRASSTTAPCPCSRR